MGELDHLLTPPEIADAFEAFGGVGLDPCSNPFSLVEARTRVYYDQEPWSQAVAWPTGIVVGDGLAIPWNGHGLVFANHPYSNGAPWLAKAASEGDEVIILTMAMPSEQYWHRSIFPVASDLLFWKGRIKFYEHDLTRGLVKQCKNTARFASALIYYGERSALFREVFAGCGWFPPVPLV